MGALCAEVARHTTRLSYQAGLPVTSRVIPTEGVMNCTATSEINRPVTVAAPAIASYPSLEQANVDEGDRIMSLTRPYGRLFLFVTAITALLATLACNSGSKSLSSAPQSSNSGGLTGAGSTFVYPIMTRWISGFQSSHSGVRINYQSIGSGGGIQQLKKGLVDFGASDAALDDNELQSMPPVVQIPESAGPVCITYNLPELKNPLRLSGTTLAGIYLGKIKTWKDPAIAKDNPGVTLPSHDIVVGHRSDGSGTSNIFTTYLAKVSPEWQKRVGKGISVSWPAGLGGKGSEGVTGVVKQTPGGIGYVELTYAKETICPLRRSGMRPASCGPARYLTNQGAQLGLEFGRRPRASGVGARR